MQDVPNICELCLGTLRNIVHILPKTGYHKNNNGTDGTDKNVHVVLLDLKYLQSSFARTHTACLLLHYPSAILRICRKLLFNKTWDTDNGFNGLVVFVCIIRDV